MQKNYRNILNELDSSADIRYSFVVSRDGLLIHPEECKELNSEAFAAMAATVLGAAEAAVDELNDGVPAMILVKARKYNIIIIGAGPRSLLAVVTSSNDTERIYEKMEKAAREIGKLI